MKKSNNKLTFAYVIFSLGLFFILLGGGVYGVYLSVGLTFVRSNMNNIAPVGPVQNVAYGDGFSNVDAGGSSYGVIVLSVILIILAIFDFVSLIKQIVFFKQFKTVRNSVIEKSIEAKVKSKKSVIAFAVIIDLLSIVAGGIGLFVNLRNFTGGSVWIFYIIDALVCLFALVSLILLLVKLSRVKKFIKENKNEKEVEIKKNSKNNFNDFSMDMVDKLEYYLLKLKYLKSSKMISTEEYEEIRNSVLNHNKKENFEECVTKKVKNKDS